MYFCLHFGDSNFFYNFQYFFFWKKGPCEVFPAPFAVFPFADDSKYLEPDISVVCDKHQLNDQGCSGAPDWIIEIVSPGSRRMDYYTKLSLYRSAGVREYWIVDHMKQTILVYDMEHDSAPVIYSFSDIVKVNIYDDLYIDFSQLDFDIWNLCLCAYLKWMILWYLWKSF